MRKTTFLAAMAMMSSLPLFSQMRTTQTSAPDQQDEVVRLNHRSREWREGEVLVKFKSGSNVTVRRNARGQFQTSQVSAVDAALQALGADAVDQLMPLTGSQTMPRRVRAINGSEVEVKDMSRLYRVRFDADKVSGVHQAVEQLQALDEVEFAEPNYLVHALSSEDYVPADLSAPNDPLYSQQWGLPAIQLPALWQKPLLTGKRPVIAILDTGVDIEHPDLKDNIWTNTAEAGGEEEADDDGNGFADDIHGWDFVNQTGHMDDFNGHGTHCAGIAGAVGNNGMGIVGANPDALIMPITVMQSDGVGDVATIIKGIDYATANGADVLSMSFGGYAYSLAEEQALGRAYAKAVLVAAAGNDNKCINPGYCDINKSMNNGPMYPAAFQFVLGVEASVNASGLLTTFSNYDCDGHLFSAFSEAQLYNYELRAPGQAIMSTYPDGNYKKLNGTSMACPLVAGAVSRLLSAKEYANKEVLFGDLIHATRGNLNIQSAYDITDADRKPALNIVTYELNDTEGGDGDMRADAGETIALYPTIKNAWGQANNIKVWLTLGENEDETIVTFLDAEQVDFGQSLSSYAKAKSVNPIRFKVKDDCVDGRHIKLQLHATCDNISEEMVQDFTITVENGVEIGGMVEHDMTLYAGVHYIVTKNLVIPSDVTLTIKPGTVIKLKDNTGVFCEGHINAQGTPDSTIIFTKEDRGMGICSNFYVTDTLKHVVIENLDFYRGYSSSMNVFFRLQSSVIRNCKFQSTNQLRGMSKNSNIYENDFHIAISTGSFKYVKAGNFIGNELQSDATSLERYDDILCTILNDSINSYSNTYKGKLISAKGTNGIAKHYPIAYLGSANKNVIQKGIMDIDINYGTDKFYLDNISLRPYTEAPGIVWKVVVNGYDAQDEFELLPPLGVGKHKVEVYYSKPVNKEFTPTIAMGVRSPYTQTSIAEDGSWNEAGDIYTAYVTLTGKMQIDGLNRIYVEGGEDLEHFEIPIENTRFNVLVQAAGSMSSGFEATPGIGKVDLQWEEQDENVDDILGYNLYRYEVKEDDSITDTLRINERLLDETQYTDFDVVPGKRYCYYYKIMRTNMAESSPSKTLAVTPLTAAKGDANGSLSVDVADVVTEIGYLTNQNPQPFIFDAADVNSDAQVNILDVVGTINIILQPTGTGIASVNDESATYELKDGVLYLTTPVDLAGLQFSIALPEDEEVKVLDALNGFEYAGQRIAENSYTMLVYSMNGQSLKAGTHALLQMGKGEVKDVVLSDVKGKNVMAYSSNTTGIGDVAQAQLRVASPNPFRESVTIPYDITANDQRNVQLVFTDLSGRTLHTYNHAVAATGQYSYTWTPQSALPQGIYLVVLKVDGKQVQTQKLVHVK